MIDLTKGHSGARDYPIHFDRGFEGTLPMLTPVILHLLSELGLLDFAHTRELLLTFNKYE